MLRRRFLSRVGPLICAFVVGAILALWALQEILSRFDAVTDESARLVEGVESVEAILGGVQAGLSNSAQPGSVADPEVPPAIERLGGSIEALRCNPSLRNDREAAARLRDLEAMLPGLGSASDGSRVPGAAAASVRMQAAAHELARAVLAHVSEDQSAIGRQLRVLVLCLSLAAIVMVNVAVYVLLKTAQMVLKPVGALVEGSRELAAEHFEHRVPVDRDDEFGELAHAYNYLAEQLEAGEERKTEALRQLAVTLNHGLNNAMSIIELQLGLMDRQAGGNPTLSRHLREIRASLVRIADTVASLQRIRRVVLAEYGPGQKMIDLERSVAIESPGRFGGRERAGAS